MAAKSVASAGRLSHNCDNGRFSERYDQLGPCLGSGGMGSVWAARVSSSGAAKPPPGCFPSPSRAAGQWVAVKAIPIELEDGDRSAGNLDSGLRECLSTFRDLSPVHVVRYDCYWMEEQEHVPAEIRRFWEPNRGRGVTPRLQPAKEDPPSPSLPSNAVPAKDDDPRPLLVLPKMESHRTGELGEEVRDCQNSPLNGNDVVSLRFCEGADQERYAGLSRTHSENLSLRFRDESDRGANDLRSPVYGMMDRPSLALSTPKSMGCWPEPSLVRSFSEASNFTDCGFYFDRSSSVLGGSFTDHGIAPAERIPPGPSAVKEATSRKRPPGRVVLLIEMELMGPKPSDSGSSEWSSPVTEDRLTLRTWLTDPQRTRGRTFSHVADVFGMLMLSVRHIHRKRLVHADLKPDNIFLIAERTDERLKVTAVRIGDFGLAGENQLDRQHEYGDQKKRSPAGGTPGYVAPEVLSVEDCPVSDKADIFACAVILLEILLPPCGTKMEWNGLLEGFRSRNAVPEFLEVRLPKTRALLRDMGAIDQTCRPSAEEICKRFEKEVRKELSRLSVQRCCSPSVLRLESSRSKKNECVDPDDDRRPKRGKKSSKRRGR